MYCSTVQYVLLSAAAKLALQCTVLSVNISCLIQFEAKPCQPSHSRRIGLYTASIYVGWAVETAAEAVAAQTCPSELLGIEPLL